MDSYTSHLTLVHAAAMGRTPAPEARTLGRLYPCTGAREHARDRPRLALPRPDAIARTAWPYTTGGATHTHAGMDSCTGTQRLAPGLARGVHPYVLRRTGVAATHTGGSVNRSGGAARPSGRGAFHPESSAAQSEARAPQTGTGAVQAGPEPVHSDHPVARTAAPVRNSSVSANDPTTAAPTPTAGINAPRVASVSTQGRTAGTSGVQSLACRWPKKRSCLRHARLHEPRRARACPPFPGLRLPSSVPCRSARCIQRHLRR